MSAPTAVSSNVGPPATERRAVVSGGRVVFVDDDNELEDDPFAFEPLFVPVVDFPFEERAAGAVGAASAGDADAPKASASAPTETTDAREERRGLFISASMRTS